MSPKGIDKMKKSVRKVMDNEEPVMVLSLEDHTIVKLYWTNKRHVDGFQIQGVMFHNGEVWDYKTRGGGFNKIDHALDNLALIYENNNGKSFFPKSQYECRPHFIGGNFYAPGYKLVKA